jgi:predicted phage tail protein
VGLTLLLAATWEILRHWLLHYSLWQDVGIVVAALGAAAGARLVVSSLPRLQDESELPFLEALGGILLVGAVTFVAVSELPSASWVILAGFVFVGGGLHRLLAPRKAEPEELSAEESGVRAFLEDYVLPWPEPSARWLRLASWIRRGRGI